MKYIMRRFGAGLLSLSLLCTSALASYALGDELQEYHVALAPEATLHTQQFWSNSQADLRTEHYISYTPHESLSPRVSYGADILNKQTLSSMAKTLENEGKRVLSGINGDYFVMATGAPLGMVVTDGQLRSSSSYLEALGFTADGTPFISKPALSMMANFAGVSLKIADINKVRKDTGYYLYTADFADSTKNTDTGVDVILAPVTEGLGETVTTAEGVSLTTSDTLKIGGRVPCVVEAIIDTTLPNTPASTPLTEGKLVLSINNKHVGYLMDVVRGLSVGDTISIDVSSPDSRWNSAQTALGGFARMVKDGQVQSGLENTANPRTAVGIKADGSMIFYTIDGRQNKYSIGATVTQVAERLVELGCVDALCLDGGGSTTLGVTDPDKTGFEIENRPSDGEERAVTNALFLVSNLLANAEAHHLYLEPTDRVLLAGASTEFSKGLMDSNFFPMESDPNEVYTYSAQKGSFDETGRYTAPLGSGVDTISITNAAGIAGETTVTVFQTPTAIRVRDEATSKSLASITLNENGSIALSAEAMYKNIPLAGNDEAFSWSVFPVSLGRIRADGTLTVGSVGGTGKVLISAGDHIASLPLTVNVQTRYTLLEDFEAENILFDSTDLKLSHESKSDYVKFGTQSLRVDYESLKNNQAALLSGNFPLETSDRVLSFWLYGDGSKNTISAHFQDATGQDLTRFIRNLDFTGWQYLALPVPETAEVFTGFSLEGNEAEGQVWFDQVLFSNKNEQDTTAPTIELKREENKLTATLKDNSEHAFSEQKITLTLDGKDIPFTLAQNTVTATLPLVENKVHRLSLTVSDVSGNLSRASETIGTYAEAESPFLDMKNHWANDYTNYLAEQNIIQGEPTKNGMNFAPNRSITRGDFALMLARFMGLDLNKYKEVNLPFADVKDIPAWSLDAVKAMYSLEILQGSEANGKTYVKAKDAISRAEAMTLLGRIQAKGYPTADLSQFKDKSDIPTFAEAHIASLVGQEVVGGSEGKLRPRAEVSRAELCKMLFTLC